MLSLKRGYTYTYNEASLSEPHTIVTSLCLFMYMLARMLGPTTYRMSFPAFILCIQKGLRIAIEDVNHEQSTSLMATTRMETTHGLTYSVFRATEVTTWQSVNAVAFFA